MVLEPAIWVQRSKDSLASLGKKTEWEQHKKKKKSERSFMFQKMSFINICVHCSNWPWSALNPGCLLAIVLACLKVVRVWSMSRCRWQGAGTERAHSCQLHHSPIIPPYIWIGECEWWIVLKGFGPRYNRRKCQTVEAKHWTLAKRRKYNTQDSFSLYSCMSQ